MTLAARNRPTGTGRTAGAAATLIVSANAYVPGRTPAGQEA